MAAVTAVVSLMLALAFRPLPFRDFTALVQVWHRAARPATRSTSAAWPRR